MCDSLIICYALPKLFVKVLEECKMFCGFTYQMKPYCTNNLLHKESRIYSIYVFSLPIYLDEEAEKCNFKSKAKQKNDESRYET
jgi:hypothetical protein